MNRNSILVILLWLMVAMCFNRCKDHSTSVVESILFQNSNIIDSVSYKYQIVLRGGNSLFCYSSMRDKYSIKVELGEDTTVYLDKFQFRLRTLSHRTVLIKNKPQMIFHLVPYDDGYPMDSFISVFWNTDYGVIMMVFYESAKEEHFINRTFPEYKSIFDSLNMNLRNDKSFFCPFYLDD